MTERPTGNWRRLVREQEAEVAAGRISVAEAWAPRLFPAEFTAALDAVLDDYEQDVRHLSLQSPNDEEVMSAVERVICALNAINARTGLIETGEREELCEFIDGVLTGVGIDVADLAARQGVGPHELTDRWRDW